MTIEREAELYATPSEVLARVFTVYVYDDRATVATLVFTAAPDEAGAREYARARLAETPHRRRVEVWEDEALIFTLPED
jgi:hypothetical protein